MPLTVNHRRCWQLTAWMAEPFSMREDLVTSIDPCCPTMKVIVGKFVYMLELADYEHPHRLAFYERTERHFIDACPFCNEPVRLVRDEGATTYEMHGFKGYKSEKVSRKRFIERAVALANSGPTITIHKKTGQRNPLHRDYGAQLTAADVEQKMQRMEERS